MSVISVQTSLPGDVLAAAAKEATSLPDSEFRGAVYGRAEPILPETSALLGLMLFLQSLPIVKEIETFVGAVRKASGMADLMPDRVVIARRGVRQFPAVKQIAHRKGNRDAFFSCCLPLSGQASIASSVGGGGKILSLDLGTAYAVPVGESAVSSFIVRETLYSLDMTLWGKTPAKPKGVRPRGLLMDLGK